MEKKGSFKSGFISIIGRPNVGKSTLLNKILSEKVAIVSDKPQTTRNRITGIKNLDNAQLIFVDTPGIHKARSNLNRHMVDVSFKAFRDSDLILLLTDEREGIGKGDRYIMSYLEKRDIPCFLLINKIDLLKADQLLSLIDVYSRDYTFSEIMPVSAATGEGVDSLLRMIVQYLPDGPRYFHEEMVTDQPERFVIAELIREKVIDSTREEVPYSVAVVIEEEGIREGSSRDILVVDAVIYVEKDSQKGIIIGKGGEMLKGIGKRAREEIVRRLGSKVYLNLWVKVKKDWRKDDKALKELGIM